LKTSVIVATYNNPKALNLCLLSLAAQTVLPDEVLIGDDGSNAETRNAILEFQKKHKNLFSVKHLWHEDDGFRKPKIMNDAVRESSGDYLIFIDGDCIAHRNFIRAHLDRSEPGTLLQGRRVEIGEQLTERLLQREQIINRFTPLLLWDAAFGRKKSRKVEEALQIKNPLLRRLLHRDKIACYGLLGCNFSVHKNLFLDVNGYDEDFKYAVEDNDVGIRVLNQGGKIKSVRGLAIVFHLWHRVRWEATNEKYLRDQEILQGRIANKEKYCRNGINKLLS
jgi:hypothetical protein